MASPDHFTYSITEAVEFEPDGLRRWWVVTFWNRRTGNWAGAADHLVALPKGALAGLFHVLMAVVAIAMTGYSQPGELRFCINSVTIDISAQTAS